MMGWPTVSLSLSATTRAIRSAVPPGAKPTMIRTGLSMRSCAATGTANASSAQTPMNSVDVTADRIAMGSSLWSASNGAQRSIREPCCRKRKRGAAL